MDDQRLVEEMTTEPTLIRRPLILDGDRLIVGFDKKGLAEIARSDAETG